MSSPMSPISVRLVNVPADTKHIGHIKLGLTQNEAGEHIYEPGLYLHQDDVVAVVQGLAAQHREISDSSDGSYADMHSAIEGTLQALSVYFENLRGPAR